MAETKAWKEGKRRAFKPDPNSTKNEWRFRLMPAKDFNSESFLRRKSQLPGISYIIGKRSGSDTYEVQSIRINKKKVRWGEAKKWWEENKDKFHFSNDHGSITPSKEKEVRHEEYERNKKDDPPIEREDHTDGDGEANFKRLKKAGAVFDIIKEPNGKYMFGLHWGESRVMRDEGISKKDSINGLQWADDNNKKAFAILEEDGKESNENSEEVNLESVGVRTDRDYNRGFMASSPKHTVGKKIPRVVYLWFEKHYPKSEGYAHHFYKYNSERGIIYGDEITKNGEYWHNATQASEDDFEKWAKKDWKKD